MGTGYHEVYINLVQQFRTRNFWGELDSNNVLNYLEKKVKGKSRKLIVFELEGVRNLDYDFCKDVFVEVTNRYTNVLQNLYLLEVNNDDLYFKIDNVFKTYRATAVVRHGEEFSLLGEVSYPSKVIFKKLIRYSPVSPEVVSREIGMEKEICLRFFEKLEEMGVAKKTFRQLYSTTLRRRKLTDELRYLLKIIKMRFYVNPMYELSHLRMRK